MNGLPYMGGKRKLAHKIVGYIMNYNPKIKYVYDLFGGGNEIFNFSNTQGKDFSQCVGHNVRVYYRQAIHLPYSEGNSNYQVDSIIILN